MKHLLIFILFVSASFCFVLNVHGQKHGEGVAENISMVKLLATPDLYHNKKISVKGYLHSKFEDSALYFSKDHANYLFVSDAIWITYDSAISKTIKPKELDENYVSVVGIFYADQKGHMGSFSGTLKTESIQKLKRWYK